MKQLFIIMILAAFVFSGCDYFELSRPLFYSGKFVKAKLDGRRGQVTKIHCKIRADGPCIYLVRFSAIQITTKTHLLSPDDPVKIGGYAIEYMHEFELVRDRE